MRIDGFRVRHVKLPQNTHAVVLPNGADKLMDKLVARCGGCVLSEFKDRAGLEDMPQDRTVVFTDDSFQHLVPVFCAL